MTGLRSVLLQDANAIIATTTSSHHHPLLFHFEETESTTMNNRWLSTEGTTIADDENMSLSIIQRIAGALSLFGGLYIFLRAWSRRHSGFDRIMLGLSFHTMLWGIYHLWGTAAIPTGTPGVYGAHGTTATCAAQGFLFQTSMVIPFYYVFLSLYSWVVILHGNFDPAKYEWIERYIHVGVHVFPLASAIYLLEVDSFNSNGLHCWIASIPSGCGDESGIECTRGPQNPHLMKWIFGGAPAIFFLLFPTVVMTTLTYCVYRRQRQRQKSGRRSNSNKNTIELAPAPCLVIPASMVAKQSAIYLGSLYWVFLPLFVYNGLNYLHHDNLYGVSLWVNLVTNSMGMWFAIVYWYFTPEVEIFDGCDGDDEIHAKEKRNPTTDTADHHEGEDKVGPLSRRENDEEESSHIFSALAKKRSLNRWSSKTAGSSSILMSETSNSTLSTRRLSRNPSIRVSRVSKRFSFNIFDGTGSSGMFADFVFDGDSDDEEKDEAESKQWEACQTIINDS